MMAARLAQLFEPFTQLIVQTVCLLVQLDDEKHWHLYREYRRPSAPSDSGLPKQ